MRASRGLLCFIVVALLLSLGTTASLDARSLSSPRHGRSTSVASDWTGSVDERPHQANFEEAWQAALALDRPLYSVPQSYYSSSSATAFDRAAFSSELNLSWADLAETSQTIKKQGPIATDQFGRWLVRTTVKSISSFAKAPNYHRPPGGQSYATDLSVHASQRAAIGHALAAPSVGTALKGSIKATTHPLALAGQFAAPVALEGYRQLKDDKTLNPGKLGRAVKPIEVGGSTAGLVAGDAAGAVVQAGLSSVGGLPGKTAGLFVRPLMSWSGFYVGRNAGKTIEAGKPSLRVAVADTLREINPAQFVCSVVGATAGGMIGQALIPIPVVGYVVGYATGGVLGTMVGNVIGKHGLTGGANKGLIAWMHDRADDIEGIDESASEDPVDVTADGTIVTVPTKRRRQREPLQLLDERASE